MNIREIIFVVFTACLIGSGLYAFSEAEGKEDPQTIIHDGPKTEAKDIAAAAVIDENHPEIEEGITCNDCHEVKVDASTTATQVWLTGDYANFVANEGSMTNSQVQEAITAVMGGKKHSKTSVLATCINNTPLSTTVEMTLDPEKMTLHGIHEKGTAKLVHIRQNPRVAVNWHRPYTDFRNILCVQFIGRAELIDGNHPEFDKILKDVISYEQTARERNIAPEKCREMYKLMMVISRIIIDEAVITRSSFRREGNYRPWQRWTRPNGL